MKNMINFTCLFYKVDKENQRMDKTTEVTQCAAEANLERTPTHSLRCAAPLNEGCVCPSVPWPLKGAIPGANPTWGPHNCQCSF